MKIENVYKCLRCGKLITVPEPKGFRMLKGSEGMQTSVITNDEPTTHHCDLINRKQIGMLQHVGFNIIEY